MLTLTVLMLLVALVAGWIVADGIIGGPDGS